MVLLSLITPYNLDMKYHNATLVYFMLIIMLSCATGSKPAAYASTIMSSESPDSKEQTNNEQDKTSLTINVSERIGDIVFTIITSVLCSVIAAFIFWRLSFRATTTNIVFSPNIERSLIDNRPQLRIRFINTGRGDLYDIRYLAQLSYVPTITKGKRGRGTFVYLNIGQRPMLPVLYGKREQEKKKNIVLSRTTTITESKDFYNEFRKCYHSESIREKAIAETLTIDDIVNEYRDSLCLQVFAFGTDSLTGIEKLFYSPRYRPENIITGRYSKPDIYTNKYKDYINSILSIKEIKASSSTNVRITNASQEINTSTMLEKKISECTEEIQKLEKTMLSKRQELKELQAQKNAVK